MTKWIKAIDTKDIDMYITHKTQIDVAPDKKHCSDRCPELDTESSTCNFFRTQVQFDRESGYYKRVSGCIKEAKEWST